MAKKERRNPRDAPMERFFWREGDVEIVYDPYEDRARKADADPDEARRVDHERRAQRERP